MGSLEVLVPSRGRPHAVAEMAEAFHATCTLEGTGLTFIVDESDPDLEQYAKAMAALEPELRRRVTIGQAENAPGTMVGALNEGALALATIFEPPVFAIGFMGDDHRPRTPGWDAAYVKALEGLGTGLVYGNDGIQGRRLPTQVAMTSDIVRALGFMAPPDLRHLYVDNFWLYLGEVAQCIVYLPEILVEHLHPVAGTAEMDEGYQRVNAPEVYAADRAAFEALLSGGGIRAAASKILDLGAARGAGLLAEEVHEWRMFPEGTVPEYTTPEWYLEREHAPHLEEGVHKARLLTTATFVAQAVMHLKIRGRKTRVVDLGAGDGGLLSLLGPAIEGWGYDLMPANLEHAPSRGVDVRYGNVLEDEIRWGDIAVCTEMIEHLVDPHAFVAQIFSHEEVKALVCSSPADERPGRAYEFHTWAWDLDGYRAMLAGAGWKVKRQKHIGGFQVLLAVRP